MLGILTWTCLALIPPAMVLIDFDDEAGRELHRKLIERFDQAGALDIVGAAKQKVTQEGQTFEMEQKGEAHLAKPAHGKTIVKYQGRPQEIIGDGERWYLIDRSAETYQDLGTRMMISFPSLSLVQRWANPDRAPEPKAAELTKEDERRRLTLEFEGGQVESYVLGEQDRILAASQKFTIEEQSLAQEVEYTFERFELTKEPDLAKYRQELPEGFTLSDPMAEWEADLIDVGGEIPDVQITTMDDETLSLRAQKGKTLLLNFWFYH